jgi:hypothetical protein
VLVNGAFGLCSLHLFFYLSFLIYFGVVVLASIFLYKKKKKKVLNFLLHFYSSEVGRIVDKSN